MGNLGHLIKRCYRGSLVGSGLGLGDLRMLRCSVFAVNQKLSGHGGIQWSSILIIWSEWWEDHKEIALTWQWFFTSVGQGGCVVTLAVCSVIRVLSVARCDCGVGLVLS